MTYTINELGHQMVTNAGRLLLEAEKKFTVQGLDAAVAEARNRSEEAIRDRIRHYSDFPLSETTIADTGWHINSLIGPEQYGSGEGNYGVSVALRERGKTVLAMVYLPRIRQIYIAEQDLPLAIQKGGRTNIIGPMRASVREIEKSVITLEDAAQLPSAIHETYELAKYLRLLGAKSTPNTIATSIALCEMVEGSSDAVVHLTSSEYDHVAALFVAERGGALTNFDGRVLIAANEHLLYKLLASTRKFYETYTPPKAQRAGRAQRKVPANHT